MGVDEATGLSFPSLFHIADAHQIDMHKIWDHKRLEWSIVAAIANAKPALIDIIMDPNQAQAPRAINRRNPDGTMNPTALEDAFPYLPREEIAEIMSGE